MVQTTMIHGRSISSNTWMGLMVAIALSPLLPSTAFAQQRPARPAPVTGPLPLPILAALPTLNTGIPHLDKFSELYVYSSGYIEDENRSGMKEAFAEVLNSPDVNKRFNVPLYFAAGETDIALNNSFKTMAIFNGAGVRTFSVLSDGGHDWANWRRYLWQTAQVMFPGSK